MKRIMRNPQDTNARALARALAVSALCALLVAAPAHAETLVAAAWAPVYGEDSTSTSLVPDASRTTTAPESDSLVAPSDEWADDEWADDEWAEWDEDFDDLAGEAAYGPDRFEGFNRAVFAFNQGLDTVFFDPLTRGYQIVMPRFARKAVRNAFLNLDSPVVMVNALLQGRTEAAGDALGRFILNSSVGLGGLIDVATMQGAPRPEADFGQTLASFGASHGPYVVVPFLGPATVRDGVGRGIDVLFQPLTYIAGPLPGALVSAGRDLTYREQQFAGLKALEESSIDFYSALRSAYLQDRSAKPEAETEAQVEALSPVSAAPRERDDCSGRGQLQSRRFGHARDRGACHRVAALAD